MVECRCSLCFLNEASEFLSVLAEFLIEEFDRDLTIKLRVLRQVHFAHTAFADFGDDCVVSECSVRGKRFAQEFVLWIRTGRKVRSILKTGLKSSCILRGRGQQGKRGTGKKRKRAYIATVLSSRIFACDSETQRTRCSRP